MCPKHANVRLWRRTPQTNKIKNRHTMVVTYVDDTTHITYNMCDMPVHLSKYVRLIDRCVANYFRVFCVSDVCVGGGLCVCVCLVKSFVKCVQSKSNFPFSSGRQHNARQRAKLATMKCAQNINGASIKYITSNINLCDFFLSCRHLE